MMCFGDGVADRETPDSTHVEEEEITMPQVIPARNSLDESSDDEPMRYPDSDDCMAMEDHAFEPQEAAFMCEVEDSHVSVGNPLSSAPLGTMETTAGSIADSPASGSSETSAEVVSAAMPFKSTARERSACCSSHSSTIA